MSLLDLLDVPLATSPLSTTATDSPRLAASSAMPAPVAPAPTTSTSSRSAVASANSASRLAAQNGRGVVAAARPGAVPVVGEVRLITGEYPTDRGTVRHPGRVARAQPCAAAC